MFTYVWDLFTGLLAQRVVYLFFLPLVLTILLIAAVVSANRDPSLETLGRALVYGTLGFLGLIGIVVLLLAIEWGTGNATRTAPDEVAKGGKPKARPTHRVKRTRREGSISDWQVKAKARAARPLLRFLAARDPAFDEERLSHQLAETVGDVLDARDDGHLRPVAGRLGPALRATYQEELDRRTADGNQRRFRPVDRVDVLIILVDVPVDPARHRVTAVVTTRSRDYVVDLDGDTLLHGDPDEAVLSQAFWTFLRDGKTWRAERVRPPEDAEDLCCLLNQLSAGLYAAFRPVADPELLNEVSAYPATSEPETVPPPLPAKPGRKPPREPAAPVVERPESPTVRCAFCHQLVLREDYDRHREKHTRPLPDGQMTDHITVHPEGRYQGPLLGVPRLYRHLRCGGTTMMPEEIVRSYLVNPFLYSGGSFCCGCNTYIAYEDLIWTETGESLGDYFRRLQAEYLRAHGEPPPQPHV